MKAIGYQVPRNTRTLQYSLTHLTVEDFFHVPFARWSLTHPHIIKIINVQVHLWELIAVHFLQVLIILYTCSTCISIKGLDLSLWITDWSYKRLHGLRPELCVTCTLITVNHFELQMYLLNLLCWQSHSLPSWFN